MSYPQAITDLNKDNHREYTKAKQMKALKAAYNMGRIAGRIEAKTAQGRKNHKEFLALLK